MKSKKVAAALAFFFGIWGVHRFYLEQRFLGVLYFMMFFFGMVLVMDGEEVPLLAVPAILGFIDFVLFMAMPKEDFDERYNKKRMQQSQIDRRRQQERSYRREYHRPQRRQATAFTPHEPTQREYKKWGVEKFRDYDFEGAVDDFERALQFKYEDPATHFNLACCYSILENPQKSFHHLDRAVAYGFNQLEKIHSHDALSFLRTQPQFQDFVRNGYQQLQELPSPKGDLLQSEPRTQEGAFDLLEQIKKLSELRDKGILTEEEFARQKRKILNN